MNIERLHELIKNLENNRENPDNEQQLLTVEDYTLWLDWVKNRIKVLDRIEEKLHQMRQLAELAKADKLSDVQYVAADKRFKLLDQEIQIIDTESRQLQQSKYH